MAIKEETTSTFLLSFGQLGLMLLAAALCAVYEPLWLIYAGILRFAWCAVAGRAGRGLLGFAAFALVYLTILLVTDDSATSSGEPAVTAHTTSQAPAAAPSSAPTQASSTIVKRDTANLSSAVLTHASFRNGR